MVLHGTTASCRLYQNHIGKVISLVTCIMSFAAPVGMLIAGPVSEMIGISNWMVISGILMIFVGILAYYLTRDL